MAKSTPGAADAANDTVIKTRELVTVDDTKTKRERAERDQQNFDIVKSKNLTDSKFLWSAEYKGGKVRVTVQPRA